MSMQALSVVFVERIISSGIWPLRSPELNPFNFFFWGCLKTAFTTVTPERKNIRTEIANIPAEQLQRINENFFWCEECLRVENSIFNTICDLWIVNYSYFIPNVIGLQACWFIGKIRMRLAADGVRTRLGAGGEILKYF
jgi:hypothetical protein